MVKSYTPLENKVKKLETIESDDISDNVSPCLENSLNDTKENVVLGDSQIDNCITENEDCTKDNNSKICQDSVTENDVNIKALSEILINGDKDNLGERMKDLQNKLESEASLDEISEGIANIEVKDDSDVNKTLDFRENDKKLENIKYEYKIKSGNDETLASVDLNTAIALINRYVHIHGIDSKINI